MDKNIVKILKKFSRLPNMKKIKSDQNVMILNLNILLVYDTFSPSPLFLLLFSLKIFRRRQDFHLKELKKKGFNLSLNNVKKNGDRTKYAVKMILEYCLRQNIKRYKKWLSQLLNILTRHEDETFKFWLCFVRKFKDIKLMSLSRQLRDFKKWRINYLNHQTIVFQIYFPLIKQKQRFG